MLDATATISDGSKLEMKGIHDRLVSRLQQLSRDELLALYDAAAEATECFRALAKSGKNPVTEVLGGVDRIEELEHFPPGDVVDPSTHSHFYYHAHAAHERAANEHGHFHTFVSSKKLFPKLQPTALPEGAGTDDEMAWIAHLVGISTDASGRVIRLFTTNRWVTGEVWYDADALINMLDRFDMTVAQPSPDLNRWITAVTHMFRPQIADLIRSRGLRVADFQAVHPDRDVFEDRGLQVTSEMPVDFIGQIRAIETALDRAETCFANAT